MEAIQINIWSNLGHCPNREGGWLGINLIFQTVYEKIQNVLKTSKTSSISYYALLLVAQWYERWCANPAAQVQSWQSRSSQFS